MLYDILKARTKPSDKALYNIWAQKLSGGWTEQEITGTLPLTFNAKAGDLTDYTIYGTAAGAGVQTENLVDLADIELMTNSRYGILFTEPGTYTCTAFDNVLAYVYARKYDVNDAPNGDNLSIVSSSKDITARTITIEQGENFKIFDPLTTGTSETIKNKLISDKVVVVKSSTVPTTYIPYGYKIPLTLTSGQHSDDYVLYIGDTQLGETEYLSFAEQKIYKDVTGTLTPTDPPQAFPAITAYAGENTLSSTETVGSVSLTGKIKEVT